MGEPCQLSIRLSRSSNRHPSRRLSSSPTVVLPDPMNPTRNTPVERLRSRAVVGRVMGRHSAHKYARWHWPGVLPQMVGVMSAFLEADFTTKGANDHGRGGLPGRAHEGTPPLECGGRRSLPAVRQREVVLDVAAYGLGTDVERSVSRHHRFDVAGVAG